MTFRKPALTVFASIAIGVALLSLALMTIKKVQDIFGAAIIVGLFAYLFWLVGWHSAIRFGPESVVIDNLLVRHHIPWTELSEIAVSNGLVFRLRDGQLVGSVMYGGSLLGAITKYPYTRNVAARMNSPADRLRPNDGLDTTPMASIGYRRSAGFSVLPLLLILAVMEAIASLSLV